MLALEPTEILWGDRQADSECGARGQQITRIHYELPQTQIIGMSVFREPQMEMEMRDAGAVN